MAIISDEDYPPPSSRSFIDISVATYHGVILKKDSLVFYIDYKTPGEAELRTSSCELLTKLELFQGKEIRGAFCFSYTLDLLALTM